MGTGRCWNCKKFEEHFYWDHLEETSLRFMKVMEGKFSHEMEFPKKFVRNFRVDLSDLITLKTSNGELWKISLFKDEDHFYLKVGWKEFIDALGIKEGYSLFFKYAGNSSFTVKIFDQTGYFRDASSFARHNKNKACKAYQTRQYRADEAASNSKRSQSSTVEMCSSRPAYDDYKLAHEISGSQSSDGSVSDKVASCKRKLRERPEGPPVPLEVDELVLLFLRENKREDMETRECWNCKKFEEHYYWNHLEETSLCFMKLMEGDFSLGMEFPNKFAWKFRADLPDLITLKVSNGDLWKIGLFKEENHFYLKDGWKEFIVANGIEEYYSLFFKYAGNSTLTVKIFDQTGCFRDTTNFTRYNKNKAYKVYQTRRHRVDVAAPNLKRSQSSAFKIYHSSRLACYDYKPEQGIPNNNSSDGSFSDEVFSCKRKLRERSEDQDVMPSQIWQGFDQEHINLYGRLKSKTKERRENSEDVFKKLKPFYVNETVDSSFVKVMMKSHICGQSFMAIPALFVSDHFHVKPKKIILCKQKQKQWIVSCRFNNSSFGFTGKSWLHFVQDNELKEGDVLFFKLINSSKEVMDVRIV